MSEEAKFRATAEIERYREEGPEEERWRPWGNLNLTFSRVALGYEGAYVGNLTKTLAADLKASRSPAGFYRVGTALYRWSGVAAISLSPDVPFKKSLGETRLGAKVCLGEYVKFNDPNGSLGVVVGEGSSKGRMYVRWYYGLDVNGTPMTSDGYESGDRLVHITEDEFNEIAGREGWGDRAKT